MARVTSIAAAVATAAMLTLGVSAGAQDFNTVDRTFLTFSDPVELPGMTLPPGTYTFRLADNPTHEIVQVLNEDETKMFGQFLYIQANRQEPTGETVITFRETREGATPAVQYWYYPGELIGKEFIYPEDQAMRIAERTGATVMTEAGPVSANSTARSTDTQGQVTEWQREETTASAADAPVEGTAGLSAENTQAENTPAEATPAESTQAEATAPEATIAAETQAAPADDTLSQPVGTSGVQDTQAESTQARAELPRTASPLALSGLIGLLSLAGAFGIRTFRG